MLLADLDRETKWQLISSTCRASFEEFCREFWQCVPGAGRVIWSWHMTVICRELQEMAERVFAGTPREHDLVVNISPGTSKSTLASILFPAWTWTRMPACRLITGSHTEALALDFSGKSRDVVKHSKYQRCFPEVQIRGDRDARGEYMNTAGGERRVCTVAGKTSTGLHAHILLIDDPIDPRRVLSEVERKVAADFMLDYIANRKVDKAVSATVLIMQRLGVGDPTDVVLAQAKVPGAAPVRHVCLPAELPDEKTRASVSPQALLMRYGEDGLMDPVRLPRSVLVENKAKGDLFYSTQFLQAPYVRGGGMFKTHFFLQRVRAAPYHARRVLYFDRAFSANEDSCHTVGTVLAHHEGNWYVGPVKSGKWWPHERDLEIVGMAQQCRDRWGPNHEPDVVVEREPAAGIDSYRALAAKLAGFRVHADPVRVNKEQRADPWASQCAAGNVFLVDDGTWNLEEWIRLHCAFPGAARKDEVDSSGGAFNWLVQRVRQRSVSSQFRILSLRPADAKQPLLRLVVCALAELGQVTVEEQSLLVNFVDPPGMRGEVMCNVDRAVLLSNATEESTLSGSREVESIEANVTVAVGGEVAALPVLSSAETPAHGLSNLLGSVTLEFGDLDPAEHQERWEEPLPDLGGMSPAQLRMVPEHGKRLWRLLTQHRDPPWQICVLCDGGDRRALSAAYAVADTLRLSRAGHIYQVSDPDGKHEQAPPNRHIYELVQASRGMVM